MKGDLQGELLVDVGLEVGVEANLDLDEEAEAEAEEGVCLALVVLLPSAVFVVGVVLIAVLVAGCTLVADSIVCAFFADSIGFAFEEPSTVEFGVFDSAFTSSRSDIPISFVADGRRVACGDVREEVGIGIEVAGGRTSSEFELSSSMIVANANADTGKETFCCRTLRLRVFCTSRFWFCATGILRFLCFFCLS